MQVKTTLLRVTDSGAVYRAALVPDAGEGGKALCLEFTVTAAGALGFDNRQPGARACAKRRISRLLAAEMAAAARARVPAALSGRTEKGLAFELRVHSHAYRLGVLRRRSAVTDMGSPSPAAPDYDRNAAWFEHPLRSIPLLRKLRRM